MTGFGFDVVSVKGSHHKLRRIVGRRKQTLHVPVHGNQPLAVGTLRAVYRQATAYIDEADLEPYFYD